MASYIGAGVFLMLGSIPGAVYIGKDHKSSYKEETSIKAGAGSAACLAWFGSKLIVTKAVPTDLYVTGFQEPQSIGHNRTCNQLGCEKVSS